MARSHRTNNERELISFKTKEAYLSGRVMRKLGNLPLEISLSRKGKKAKVNHLEQARLSQYIGNLNVILFCARRSQLSQGVTRDQTTLYRYGIWSDRPTLPLQFDAVPHDLKATKCYLKQLQQKKKRRIRSI